MWREYRIGVGVLPRQSGKDVAMSMESCERRLRTPKTTGVYVSLDNPMIRDILWDKTYLDPESRQYIQALQDNVPSELVKWSATVMEGRFSNKSRLKLQGYFQSGRDKNGVGTSFQDYAFTELALFTREDPIPRLMPIINNPAEDKKLMAVSTPRGKRRNPLWQLMQAHAGDENFKVITYTIDDLNEMMRRVGAPPVMGEAELERIQDSYKKRFGNDRMFEQEYYVSFEEMDAAAVYGEAYMKMVQEGRVQPFNLDPGRPVYVVFDIGASGLHSDATAWIAFQWYNDKLRIYDSGEGHGKALPEYVDVLRQKHYFPRIAQIILPWDGEHHEKAVNTTPADMMRAKFPNVAVLAKSNKVWKIPGNRSQNADEITDIQQGRMMLYNTIINGQIVDDPMEVRPVLNDSEISNEWLLECFENYKFEFNTKEQQWTERPLHDRHSHLMDAYRYAVQSTKELDFFGGEFYDQSAHVPKEAVDYVEDWRGVWN